MYVLSRQVVLMPCMSCHGRLCSLTCLSRAFDMPVLCRQVVLFLCCLLNETFFVMGYLYFYATQGDRPAAKVLKKKSAGGLCGRV